MEIYKNTWAIEEKTIATQGLCYLVSGSERALLIDTCFGFRSLEPLVRSLTPLPVTVACTHGHVDHIGGNHLFGEIWLHTDDRPVFALHTNFEYVNGLFMGEISPFLRLLLGNYVKKIITIDPSGDYHYFEDGHIFHLGGRDIEVIHTPGHTPGSVCFLDREARLLFSGDTVCEWGILLMLKGETCPPETFLASMERLLALEKCFDTIWPGHHHYPVDKSYITEYRDCAQEIVEGRPALMRKKGRLCAQHKRILIALPSDWQGGRALPSDWQGG
jgi:glyoxylase-like metal-dependent hydrolase (beta-lactamase superfamily II)